MTPNMPRCASESWTLEEIQRTDDQRTATEVWRSRHRNGNRLAVLVVGLVATLFWPPIARDLFHSVYLATFASAIGYTVDLAVTYYALRKTY